MFLARALLLKKRTEQFQKQRDKLTPEASSKEFKSLQKLANQIKEIKIFPRYLSLGIVFTFVSYMMCAFVSAAWLVNPINRTPDAELVIMITFVLAHSAFLTLGAITVIDISLTMKREYERIKRKLEEDKEFQGLFVK